MYIAFVCVYKETINYYIMLFFTFVFFLTKFIHSNLINVLD